MVGSPSAVDTSKRDIRERAAQFAKRWEGTTSEQAEKQTFWNEFFAVFGIDRKMVGGFEALAERASTGTTGWIDLLYPGQMAVEHKSAGKDLDDAMGQLVDYLPTLPKAEYPWLLVVSDFANFQWRNLESGEQGTFTLAELPQHLDLFWWLAGHSKPNEQWTSEEDANLKATELLEVVHHELRQTGYPTHALGQWLTRVLFCLFADDTEVWDRALFHTYLARHTKTDGSDLGQTLALIFQTLDTPDADRSSLLDEDLATFTYINGDLFDESLPIPVCNEAIRDALLDACRFNWGIISPAIFGSLFQGVMLDPERRQIGAHYTSEPNILRTIRPLFLDDLERELAQATSRPKLDAFHNRLAALRFFDPACGCGNFLVIAYREIRRLETEALRRLAPKRTMKGQRAAGLDLLCKVRVDQFYGIEVEEFPAQIARTALYLIDHIANREVSVEFGEHYVRFPIPASPHIMVANALRMSWDDLVGADKADYVFGNPPFVGMSHLTQEQDDDNGVVFKRVAPTLKGTGRLDYVTCWYAAAIEYAAGEPVRFAFVSTNSITQGEQARVMAPLLRDNGFGIDFAHRTFSWTSEARGKAHVHVVIVGFSFGGAAKTKILVDYSDPSSPPITKAAKNINWYLADAPDVLIAKHTQPLVAIPKLTEGNRPEDGGGLVLTDSQAQEIRAADQIAAKYLRPLISSKEYLSGTPRWCLWLVSATATEIRNSPVLRERLEIVRKARLGAKAKTKNDNRKELLDRLAAKPALFVGIRQPSKRYLCIPRHSSSNRRIVPMWFCEPDEIAHDSTLTLEGAPLWLFGVMQSAMFGAWLRSVAGRLKSDIRVAPDLAYNAFPFSVPSPANLTAVEAAAKDVLDARAKQRGTSLAVLYDVLATPPPLSKAHDVLDRAVDRLFAPKRKFKTDADRLALLFDHYIKATEPLTL